MARLGLSDRPVAAALREELDVTATTSRATLRARISIALVGWSMLGVVIGPAWAASCFGLLCALEVGLHLLAKFGARKGRGAQACAILFVALLISIACAWSVGPICLWRTGRAPLQAAGMAILVAQMIDVQCYTFRQRITPLILGGVPALLFLALPLQAALSLGAKNSDEVILAFCLTSTLLYFAAAVQKNRSSAEALEHAGIQAQAANRAKSAFIAMISHELRTPMNGVIGLAYAMKTSTSQTERDQQTDSIIRSGESLMVLLNDILDLSKVEAGGVKLELHVFDPRALVADLHALWAPSAQARGLQFETEVELQHPVWLCGDDARLRQILSNLVSNAIKFTALGSVCVQMTLKECSEQRIAMIVQVRDTGMGISDAEKALLFRPFSQARASVSRQFGGTGLGLAISRGLVELMGGSLSIDSRPGLGSTFEMRLTLPVASPPVRRPEASTEFGADFSGARILVVDDNPINLQVASALLGALGATTSTAPGGEQALAHLSDGVFDLVLLDIHMPGMSGLDVLRRIRTGGAGQADIAVVACTADAMTDGVAQLLDEGFDAVQSKPIVPKDLAATLGPFLERRVRLVQPPQNYLRRGDPACAS